MGKSAIEVQNGWFDRSQAIEIALRALPTHLMKQRWYPAKDAGLPVVALKGLISFPCEGVTVPKLLGWLNLQDSTIAILQSFALGRELGSS